MRDLWMEILPGSEVTEVLVENGPGRRLLEARLPQEPSHPRAVEVLCEALALWCGRKVCAALVVEGPESFCATRPWLDTFETVTRPPLFEIHFVSLAPAGERGEVAGLASYRDLRQRIFSEEAR